VVEEIKMNREIAIVAQDVARVYESDSGAVHALKQINFEIREGTFIVLKGRSGSGKTTLLNCLGGLDTPTRGSIRIFEHEISAMNDAQRTRWRRERVGFVFQQMGLLPGFSCYENLDIMARLANVPRKDRRSRIFDSLEQVGLLEYFEHRPYEMSGGQQQRIAIARALVSSPRLLLADEPTSELDSQTTHDILALFRKIVHSTGMTIMLTSHDPIVDEYVDEIVYLRDGMIGQPDA
jgi:ABC-type lipoprotein export system ATPase subunit